MRLKRSDLRAELPPLLCLALPLIAGELGWISMSLVDTIMLGHLPNPALPMSAAALAQVPFNLACFGVSGILLGLDTLISQAVGAKEQHQANRWLFHGIVMAVLLSALLTVLFAFTPLLMLRLPVDHAILQQAAPALQGLNYGTLPLLLYFTLRRYLQAEHHGRPIAFALITANLVNAAGDWALIFGHHLHLGLLTLRIPAFGVTGSSWATSLARLYLMLVLLIAVWRGERTHHYGLQHSLRSRDNLTPHLPSGSAAPAEHSIRLPIGLGWFELSHLRRLFLLGAPAGASIVAEIGIFALVTSLIATFGPLSLAGHEVALQCASTTYMVPFAISAATSVRVGHAIGRMRIGAAQAGSVLAAGWSGIGLGALFMLCASLLLLAIPSRIAHLFTPNPGVIAAAVPLLLIAAGFQFFDGVQVTATGALRGAGNTRMPFLIQLVGYWGIGMPLGILLGFHQKMGAAGLWWGLLIALASAAILLCLVWRHTTRALC
ncbi:MAG: MATE family efflux transporter [Acidobacteriaceae bacterium]